MMKPTRLLAPLALLAFLAPASAPAQPSGKPAPTAKPTAAPSAQPTAAPVTTSAPATTGAPAGTATPPVTASPDPTAPPTATAAPAPEDEGRQHFQRGVELFRETNFRAALVEFNRSYEVSHNYKVLYNIGQTQFEMQDYAAALRSFERYLNIGGAEIDPARRSQVEADMKSLATRVARLDIKSNTSDAEILIDDVSAGKTPLDEPLIVSIGRRKVVLQKNGVASPPRTIDLAGGDKMAVTIDLKEVKAEEPQGPSRTGLWVGLAITGGLVAGTAIVGGLALSAHGAQQETLGKFGAKKSEIDAARSKTQTLALVADILGGTAIAMAGVTIVLGVTGGKSNPPEPKAAITVGPRGLSVGGSF